MTFSNCGKYLLGFRLGYPRNGEPVMLHVEPRLSRVPLAITNSHSSASISTPSRYLHSDNRISRSEGVNASACQISGMPQFTDCQGQLQISALTQNNDCRSVMLQTMRADGKMIEETITRLPHSSTLEKSYSTLVPPDSHQNLRIVLNMAIQDTYTTSAPDLQLPAVLDWTKASIPKSIIPPNLY